MGLARFLDDQISTFLALFAGSAHFRRSFVAVSAHFWRSLSVCQHIFGALYLFVSIFGVEMTQCVGAEAYKYPCVARKGLSLPVTFASAGSSPSDIARRGDHLTRVLSWMGDICGYLWVLS